MQGGPRNETAAGGESPGPRGSPHPGGGGESGGGRSGVGELRGWAVSGAPWGGCRTEGAPGSPAASPGVLQGVRDAAARAGCASRSAPCPARSVPAWAGMRSGEQGHSQGAGFEVQSPVWNVGRTPGSTVLLSVSDPRQRFLTLLPPLNFWDGIWELPVNFLQSDESKCSIWGSTCLGALHELEGLCLHTHSGSVTAAARLVVPALGGDVERAVWLKKAGKRAAPRTLEAVFALEGDSRGLQFRHSQDGCGWWGGTGHICQADPLPMSPNPPGQPGCTDRWWGAGDAGKVLLCCSECCLSCRKTCKGQCLAGSCNRGVWLQPPEAHGPLSPSLSQHPDSRHLL